VIFRWEEYLVLAKELSRKVAKRPRDPISRAYCAAYQTARKHNRSKSAVASRGGSHGAVWNALRTSGNANWRRAGNQGMDILESRRNTDYDDEVPGVTHMMHTTIRTAEEILWLLGS
jgi:hypothetical protein